MGYEQGDMPFSGQHRESSTIFIPATATVESVSSRWHCYVMEKGCLIHIELGMSESLLCYDSERSGHVCHYDIAYSILTNKIIQ